MIQDDVTGLGVDLTELEGDVNFLFDEQIIQDERLFSLEQTTIGITEDLDSVEDQLEGYIFLMIVFILGDLDSEYSFAQANQLLIDFIHLPIFTALQDTTLILDFRVTALEENGGSNGNSSIAEQELRVETLEVTAADHQARISTAEAEVNAKE